MYQGFRAQGAAVAHHALKGILPESHATTTSEKPQSRLQGSSLLPGLEGIRSPGTSCPSPAARRSGTHDISGLGSRSPAVFGSSYVRAGGEAPRHDIASDPPSS